ncbi:hypothetical protein NE237_029281 [Protea cynaroides]|uniref:Uncharacterized protein n=1 Tax=Protea cynaroides TaxID=273540 RepID=A0A9Q0GVI2_9MAGN|nr:hypothetical protein NE237_029281 [Protea cynaroides]
MNYQVRKASGKPKGRLNFSYMIGNKVTAQAIAVPMAGESYPSATGARDCGRPGTTGRVWVSSAGDSGFFPTSQGGYALPVAGQTSSRTGGCKNQMLQGWNSSGEIKGIGSGRGLGCTPTEEISTEEGEEEFVDTFTAIRKQQQEPEKQKGSLAPRGGIRLAHWRGVA